MRDGQVRLAIANDYEVVVRGLASLLAPHEDRIRIVELSVDDSVNTPVDVVLFDVFGSGEVHTGDVRRVLDSPFARNVAVYTANFDQSLIDTAMRMGIKGYLSKGMDAEQLVDAVCRIADGEVVVARSSMSRDSADRRWPGKLHDLSEREAEVLALIAQGYENDEIARRLYISVNTLKTRIRTMYRRMGFENRVQAAVWAVKHGFETDAGASSNQAGTSADEMRAVTSEHP
jgi:two-component system, NarL family, response regulator LiaR